jgi:hypothetical protein
VCPSTPLPNIDSTVEVLLQLLHELVRQIAFRNPLAAFFELRFGSRLTLSPGFVTGTKEL